MKQISDMLECTADGAMLVNEDGTVTLWNKAAERLLGLLVKDMIGRPFFVGQV
jgi:PAS domain S-box-containing protein